MPTAVMMLSTEKTMSMRMIWTRPETRPSGVAGFPSSASSSGSTRSWISVVAFQTRNSPPASNSRSRTEKAWPSTVASGSGQAHHPRRRSKQRQAEHERQRQAESARQPRRRSSMRFVSSAMNTRLSRPSTTSMTIRVASAAHASGSSTRRRKASISGCSAQSLCLARETWTPPWSKGAAARFQILRRRPAGAPA